MRSRSRSWMHPASYAGATRSQAATAISASMWSSEAAQPSGTAPTSGSSAPAALASPPPSGVAGASVASPVELLPRVDLLLALVQRVTQGFNVQVWAEARALGYDAFLEQQLAPEALDDGQLEQKLAPFASLAQTGPQLLANYPHPSLSKQVPLELKSAMLLRSVHSRRQLFERHLEFLTDHFSIDHFDGAERFLKTLDDRDVLRENAFGRFGALLRASAHSAAMLHYLDNHANVKGKPQENYARELLELHSLGVGGGYSEADVKEVARCLTGWSFHDYNDPAHFGEFVYVAENHDEGAKLVLGNALGPGGGKSDGDFVLSLLSAHPATREFVCRKLCRWYLAYDPPESVVEAAQQSWLASGGELRSVLRTILSQESLAAAQAWKKGKLKRPFHFASSLLRALGADVHDAGGVLGALTTMGQLPYDWPAPNGYPDALVAWSGGLHGRWTFASNLLDGAIAGIELDANSVLAALGHPLPSDAGRAINALLTGGTMRPNDEAAVQAYVDSFPNVDWPVLREAIALAASSPSYQWY
jgi:uncharacterized protein (DUF1800 family)